MPLTDRAIRAADAGRHSDGQGLSLLVQRSGSRSWVLRVQRDGRRRDIGLGAYPEVGLAAARDKARELRRAIKAGEEPRRPAPEVLTFRAAAEALIASKRAEWRNGKHAAQWPSTLQTYVFPSLGDRDVVGITTEDVLNVLKPIWTTKTETAVRVRQRVEAVLSYAMTLQGRFAVNPATWKGHLENLLPKPGKIRRVRHFPALPWAEAPEFFAALLQRHGTGPRALAFAILTAARSGEVRGMTWGEVDVESGLWVIPGHRMKAGKDHRVPLVPLALELMGEPATADALVFASPMKADIALSDMTLAAVLKRMGRADLTVHGFRSSFRDWAGETTGHPREVIEAALAHQLKDKAEAAYARSDLLLKRRRLMNDWAGYLASTPAALMELRSASPERLRAG